MAQKRQRNRKQKRPSSEATIKKNKRQKDSMEQAKIKRSHTVEKKRPKKTKKGKRQRRITQERARNSKQPKKRTLFRKKKKRGKRSKHKGTELLFEVLLSLGIFALLSFLLFHFTLATPKVEGYSMTPTVNDQDRLMVLKHGQVRRFSLIYFNHPENKGEQLVRRVIGRPGETIEYREGLLFIDDAEVPERFLSSLSEENSDQPLTEAFTLKELQQVSRVPEDCYFVLGDNRPYATDSRFFGFVKKEDIVGVVRARIFPIHSMRQFN